MPTELWLLRLSLPQRTLATVVVGVFLLIVDTCLKLYNLWLQTSTWILNWSLSVILVWWFHLQNVTITIEEFGFCSIKGAKIKWKEGQEVDIDEVTFQIDWTLKNIRDVTMVFHVRNLQKEVYTNLKDATSRSFASFNLHWKMHSPSELLSSDMRNSSETIPENFHSLNATEVEIGSKLELQTGGCYVELWEATAITGLLVPTKEATTLILKGTDVTYSCSRYDVGLFQAREEKALSVPILNLKASWSSQGPAQFSITCREMQLALNPRIINYGLVFLNNLWFQLGDKSKDSRAQPIDNKEESNANKGVEFSTSAEDFKISLRLSDEKEAAILSFPFSFRNRTWKEKTQYIASFCVQVVVPSPQQTVDPCVIIGSEVISTPWKFSLSGSNVTGNSTALRVFSEQSFCAVLRSECVITLFTLYQDYICSLDHEEVRAAFAWLSEATSRRPYPQEQRSLDLKGVRVSLEMDIFEELMNVTLEGIKGDYNRDQDNSKLDLNLDDFEVEDCVTKVIAVQQPRTSDQVPQPILSVSLIQDETETERKIVVKKLYIRLGDSIITIDEELVLKLLQFSGIKDKTQLWGKEATGDQEEPSVKYPAILTATPCFFQRIEFEPFSTTATSNPAKNRSEEDQLYKDRLAIPSGFPPLMEKANIQFGEFVRTGINYRTLLAFLRDARRHYLKEIGRHSGSLLGSLHLLGNLSSLHGEIADGLADLRQTGDYIEFVKHVRGGLAESYYKFTDSWSSQIKKPAVKNDNPVPQQRGSTPDNRTPMNSMRGVVGTLTSLMFSPSSDSRKLQFSSASSERHVSPPDSPSHSLVSKRLALTDLDDRDSSCSEESSLSCIKSVEDWDLVSKDAQRLLKGQEFLQRLQVSLNGGIDERERFIICLKLRHHNPEDKLNALVTCHRVYFMKVGSPTSDHVVLTIKLVDLYKARHKFQDEENYLELQMRISGGTRLSLPSPNPADNPLVRCGSAKIAQKAARVINEAKKKSEEKIV